MPSLFQLKDIIREFTAQNLPKEFKTIYWQSERKRGPSKPYCMLTELSETYDAPTSEIQLPNSLTKQVTMYKIAVITIAVYVDGLCDYDERKNFAYQSLNKIRTKFDILQTHYRFKKDFAIKSLSGIRALNDIVNGGYLFRYEFDLTIGFNEIYEYDLPVSRAVNIDLDRNNIHIKTEDIT